jgi:hypothetical protein
MKKRAGSEDDVNGISNGPHACRSLTDGPNRGRKKYARQRQTVFAGKVKVAEGVDFHCR